MIRLKPPALRLESLEDRAVPAVFGEPWLDGRHVTLSFAGDGTSISGVSSNLTATLTPLSLDAAKLEILRAFQSWVVNSNLNVGLVNDSNLAFGTAGAIQSDPRFGDIRVGARNLASDVLAITAPFSLISPSSGDLILNSGKTFTIGGFLGTYDLFTVFMQEAGHTFGVGNSTDPNSVMYETYGLARIGLSDGDKVDIKALYGGDRAKDAYEGTGGNNTIVTATTYAGSLQADLTNAADVDVYRYTADGSEKWFKLRAKGLSLVAAKVEVLDANGNVIAWGQTTSPLQNDVTVYTDQLVAGNDYYIRVSAARSDVFAVGAYRLLVDSAATDAPPPDPNALVDGESLQNDTVATATQPTAASSPYDYSFRSSLSTASDVDFFRIHAPTTASKLTVTVAGVGKASFAPNVDLYTTAGVRVDTTVVARTDSSVVLSLTGTLDSSDYLIRVTSSNGTVGNYDVVADFRTDALPKMMGAYGALDSGHTSTSATLKVWQSQTIQVNLVANLQNGTNSVAVVRIYDSQNQLVFELFGQTGILTTAHVFLRRGIYTTVVQTLDGNPIDFSLSLFGVSDPIDANPIDNTGGSSGDPLGTPPPNGDTTTVTGNANQPWAIWI
jgi:Matrixin